MSNIYAPGKANIKGYLAGILLVGGLLMCAFANQVSVRQHLVGYSAHNWPDRNFHRVAFTRNGSLLGATADGTRLNVELLSRSGNDSTKWSIDLGRSVSSADLQTEWVLDREGQRLAYATPDGITIRPLCQPGSSGCAGSQLNLPAASRSLLAFAFVPGRMLAAAFDDSSVKLWDSETGNEIGRLNVTIDSPDQARWEADYLAIVASGSQVAKIFRLGQGPVLKAIEESKTPMPPFKLITPGTGQIGYLSAGGVYYRGATRNSPGTVRAAVLGENDLLVGAGDFDGLQVLAAQEDPYPLLEDELLKAQPSVMAADSSRFAYSGQGGTGLVGLATESRITATGRRFNFIGLILAGIGGLLAASGFLFDLVGMSFKAQGVGKKSRKTLLDPDPSLINAFLDGQVVLWVGAGLSAQAGFPTRSTFMFQTLQTADGETWIESKLLMAMYERVKQGNLEPVFDEIIETLHYQRSTLVQHFKVVYSRFTPLSPCHKTVRRLPIAAAITTNYDGCLEMLGPMWANNVVNLKQGAHRGAAEKDQFFLLRLYGDPRVPAEVKLSHKEFAESVKADPTLGDTLQVLFDKKTMFFVGSSPAGLLSDLRLMPKVKKTQRKHYAVVGVGQGNWDKAVQALETEYGITSVVCAEETIPTELPRFLEILANEIETAKTDRTAKGKNVVTVAVKKATGAA